MVFAVVDEDHGPDVSQAVLDEVLDAAAPSLWFSGHQHSRMDGALGSTERHVLDMLSTGCNGLSEDQLFWLSGESRAPIDAPAGWGLPGGNVLPVRGRNVYRYAVMDELPPDLFAVFDKRRKYYRTRRDGDIKGIVPDAVDSFFSTLCAVSWDLETAAARKEVHPDLAYPGDDVDDIKVDMGSNRGKRIPLEKAESPCPQVSSTMRWGCLAMST